MDRGAWWAVVHRVTKSWTRLKREHPGTHAGPLISELWVWMMQTRQFQLNEHALPIFKGFYL